MARRLRYSRETREHSHPSRWEALRSIDETIRRACQTVARRLQGVGSKGPVYQNRLISIAAVLTLTSMPAFAFTDLDQDGIDDATDNCPDHVNATQLDTDGDGFGNACDADLNNDGVVNVVDLGLFRLVFFSADPNADFNGDGNVNVADLGILRTLFGKPPGPLAHFWVAPAGGSWSNPANWQDGRMPGTHDAVRIPLDNSQSIVIDDLDATASSVLSTAIIVTRNNATLSIENTVRLDAGAIIESFGRIDAGIVSAVDPSASEIQIPDGETGTLTTRSLGVDVTIGNDALLTVGAHLHLVDASITLAAADTFSTLQFASNSEQELLVSGVGEIVFSGTIPRPDRNQVVSANGGRAWVIESGITLRTEMAGGQWLGGEIDFRGTIMCDVENGDLILVAQTGELSMGGTALATNGCRFNFEGVNVAINGTIDVSGGGQLRLDSDNSEEISIDGAIRVTDGRLTLSGSWINRGLIEVINGVFLSDARFAPIDNNGQILLTNTDAEISNDLTLQSLGDFQLDGALFLTGRLDNTGQALDLSDLPGNVDLNFGTIIGGEIVGTPIDLGDNTNFTLEEVVLSTDMFVGGLSNLLIQRSLTLNNSVITLNGGLQSASIVINGFPDGRGELVGTGEVRSESDPASSFVNSIQVALPQDQVTIGPDIVLHMVTRGVEFFVFPNASILVEGQVVASATGTAVRAFSGSTTFSGEVVMGVDATLLFWSPLAFTESATLSLELGDPAVPRPAQIEMADAPLSLAGTLHLRTTPDFVPVEGTTWPIAIGGTQLGSFSSITGDAGDGLSFGVNYEPEQTTVTVGAKP